MTTILVVDDEKPMRQLLRYMLRELKYEFLEASNGFEGQTIALRTKPDLVLLDVMMPIQDGYQTCANLRAAGYDRTILMMSVLSPLTEADKAIQIGANAYIQKPVTRLVLNDYLLRSGFQPALTQSARRA